jgi:hypothetical protein
MFKSQKSSVLILLVTALVFSRAIFYFLNDPEGPNLLVVGVMAAILYFLSWLGLKLFKANSLWMGILLQAVLAFGFYFLM